MRRSFVALTCLALLTLAAVPGASANYNECDSQPDPPEGYVWACETVMANSWPVWVAVYTLQECVESEEFPNC